MTARTAGRAVWVAAAALTTVGLFTWLADVDRFQQPLRALELERLAVDQVLKGDNTGGPAGDELRQLAAMAPQRHREWERSRGFFLLATGVALLVTGTLLCAISFPRLRASIGLSAVLLTGTFGAGLTLFVQRTGWSDWATPVSLVLCGAMALPGGYLAFLMRPYQEKDQNATADS